MEDQEMFKQYFKEIVKIPLLSEEEEKELIQRAKSGDKKAKERLILANLRLVVSVARHYYGVPILDLIQEGNIGLMKAIERFDPQKGYKFSTYAVWWINQAIRRAMVTNLGDIRIPGDIEKKIRELERIEMEIKSRGKEPDPQKLVDKMKISKKSLQNLQKARLIKKLDSLDRPLGNGDECLGDFISDKKEETFFEEILKELQSQEIEKALSLLSKRERKIIELRYGLKDGRFRILNEVGKEVGLSRERVRQIEKKALEKLNDYLRQIRKKIQVLQNSLK